MTELKDVPIRLTLSDLKVCKNDRDIIGNLVQLKFKQVNKRKVSLTKRRYIRAAIRKLLVMLDIKYEIKIFILVHILFVIMMGIIRRLRYLVRSFMDSIVLTLE